MKRITVPEEGIETLFGTYDENLKHLESLFGVRIRTQGHDLLVEGDPPALDKVDRIVDQPFPAMAAGVVGDLLVDEAAQERGPHVEITVGIEARVPHPHPRRFERLDRGLVGGR